MADDAKADDYLEQLREGFAGRIRDVIRDLPAHQAMQLADSLCTIQLNVLAGMRVTYKSAPKVDGDAISEDWARGMSIGEITGKYGVSKATAYRFHPNKVRSGRAG